MSDIKINNPKQLLLLAEYMEVFKKRFELFSQHIKEETFSTMDKLTALRVSTNYSIRRLEAEIVSLTQNYNSCLQIEGNDCSYIFQQVREAESQIADSQILLQKIDKLQDYINNTYKHDVLPIEQRVLEKMSDYPKGLDALLQMEKLMEQYTKYSSGSVPYLLSNLSQDSVIPKQSNSQELLDLQFKSMSTQEAYKQYHKKKQNGLLTCNTLPSEKICIDSHDIIVRDDWNTDSKNFWEHHGNSKEKYLNFVASGQSENLTGDHITVYKYGNKYVQEGDGSHRIAASQELNKSITVWIIGEWIEK